MTRTEGIPPSRVHSSPSPSPHSFPSLLRSLPMPATSIPCHSIPVAGYQMVWGGFWCQLMSAQPAHITHLLRLKHSADWGFGCKTFRNPSPRLLTSPITPHTSPPPTPPPLQPPSRSSRAWSSGMAGALMLGSQQTLAIRGYHHTRHTLAQAPFWCKYCSQNMVDISISNIVHKTRLIFL